MAYQLTFLFNLTIFVAIAHFGFAEENLCMFSLHIRQDDNLKAMLKPKFKTHANSTLYPKSVGCQTWMCKEEDGSETFRVNGIQLNEGKCADDLYTEFCKPPQNLTCETCTGKYCNADKLMLVTSNETQAINIYIEIVPISKGGTVTAATGNLAIGISALILILFEALRT